MSADVDADLAAFEAELALLEQQAVQAEAKQSPEPANPEQPPNQPSRLVGQKRKAPEAGDPESVVIPGAPVIISAAPSSVSSADEFQQPSQRLKRQHPSSEAFYSAAPSAASLTEPEPGHAALTPQAARLQQQLQADVAARQQQQMQMQQQQQQQAQMQQQQQHLHHPQQLPSSGHGYQPFLQQPPPIHGQLHPLHPAVVSPQQPDHHHPQHHHHHYQQQPQQQQQHQQQQQQQQQQSKEQSQPKKKLFYRVAAGELWVDEHLSEWPDQDWRIFCGDLGGDVTDEMLTKAFQKYPSFVRARVIRIKSTGKSRGYAFVSFTDPHDMARAIREMDGKYVGQRPVKLRKAKSDARTITKREAKRLVDSGEVQIAANCKNKIRF